MLQIKIITGGPTHRNQARKRNKKHSNQKKSSKTVTLCRYIENRKDSIKPTARINKHSKFAKYKINTHKSTAFLLLIMKYQKDIPLTTASKRIKGLGTNLTKEMKDMCTENIRH